MGARSPRGWSTPADVRAKVRRRWDDGSLLRSHAAGEAFPVVEVPLRRPRASEIGDDLEAVRAWVASVVAGSRGGSRYEVVSEMVGGRVIGRNELPARAVVRSFEQAWALLDVGSQVRELDRILALVGEEPALRGWVAAHPLRALRVGSAWDRVLRAYRWLVAERGSGRYLREIDAPGVDTKFVDEHRALLAQLLEVPSSSAGFVSALGLRGKPEFVRLRFGAMPGSSAAGSTVGLAAGSTVGLAAGSTVGLAAGFSEAVLRREELAAAPVQVRRATIVENEITYLSVPVPEDGVVIWGKGFEVDRAGSLPWLRDVEVDYWGDIDTHGFAILDRLRAWLPQTRSVLMDRDTLLEHRGRWGREPSPTTARLDRLTPEEAALYADLVSDRFAERLRLEQERVDWAWVLERLGRRVG